MDVSRLRKKLHKFDRSAVTLLVEEYKTPLLRFAFSFVRDERIAEDVVSEALVRLLIKKPRLRSEGALKGYLFSVTKNVAVDYLRKKKREKAYSARLGQEEREKRAKPIENSVIENERYREVTEALSGLNERYREALYLQYFEEMSVEDIAKIMGGSKKQTYNLLARAKAAMKEILKEGEE